MNATVAFRETRRQRLPFLPPLAFLIAGLTLGSDDAAIAHFAPRAAAALIAIGAILVARGGERALTAAVLSAALLAGIVAAPRISTFRHAPSPDRSAVSLRMDDVFAWSTSRFARAVMLAETEALDMNDRVRYRLAGVTHLLAISGLNVAIMAGLMRLAAGVVTRGASAELVSAAATIVYVFGIGAPPSALRAGVMAAVIFVARAAGRTSSILNALFGAAFLTLLFDPSALPDPGFQLSYAATFGLILWTKPIERLLPARPRHLRTLLATSAAAQLAVTPILLWHFGELAPIAFLANIPLIPIFSVIIPLIVLALCGVPGTAFATEGLHDAITAIVDAFSRMPGASFPIARPPQLALLAMMALCALPLLQSRGARFAAVIALGALALFATLNAPDHDGVWVVREGSSIGIIGVEQGHAEVVDPGLRVRTWRRAILELGMPAIDTIQLTKIPRDEAGFSPDLQRLMNVTAWEMNEFWKGNASIEHIAHELRQRGSHVAWRSSRRPARLRWKNETVMIGDRPDTGATVAVNAPGRTEIRMTRDDGRSASWVFTE